MHEELIERLKLQREALGHNLGLHHPSREVIADAIAALSAPSVAPQKDAGDDMTGTGAYTSAGSVPYFRQEAIEDMNRFADALENGPTLRAIWAELYAAGYAPPSMDHVEGVKMVCAELKRLQLSCRRPCADTTPELPSPSLAAHAKGEDGK